MSAETDRSDLKSPVDLAREADFTLGASRVSPSTREVLRGAEREILEPRVMQVLVALFQANGRVVSRDELIARCWEGRIVGEDAINRAIGRLRRLSEVDREASFVVDTIPRVGYRLVASSSDIPQPPVSELGAPSPGPQNEKVQIVAAGAVSRRWLAIAALVLAGAAAVTSAAWLLWPAKPAGVSVAVLPFDTLDSNGAARVFGKEVAEQIVVGLNDVQVRTVSREEAAALSGASRDAAAVKLGAEFIVNGSVQSGEKGLHVTVHLDHTSTGAAVWTASYDQKGAAALEFQWQIAANVSQVVQRALSARRDDPGEMDDAALGLNLKLVANIGNVTQEILLEQYGLARQLIARAPKYAQAYSELAIISEFLSFFLQGSAPPDQVAQLRADAKKAASQALALDPKNGAAYQAMAGLVPNGRRVEREAIIRKGLAVAPNYAFLSRGLCGLLTGVGRMQEALVSCTTSRMLAPQSAIQHAGLARAQIDAGQIGEGIFTINRAAKIWPSHPGVWMTRFNILANFGHVDEARAMLDSAQNIPVSLQAKAIAALRAYLEAMRLNTPASKTAAGNAIRSAMATGDVRKEDGMRMFAKLGDVDTAFALARTLSGPRGDMSPPFLFDSVTDSMRRDPRFMPLAAQMGLVDYWTTTGKWPDFCSQPGLPYDCRAAARALTPKAVTPR